MAHARLRWFYPIDWPLISARIRFERAGGRCEACGRPHNRVVEQLADGRWYDEDRRQWRDDRGAAVDRPDIVDHARLRRRRYALSVAHLDHDSWNSRLRNLRALCQRCHLAHDRARNGRRRRLNRLARRALGDLFDGRYPVI